MLLTLLKAKIKGVRLTDVDIHCSGSFGVDVAIMDQLGIHEHEKVLVINRNTGARFETYVIKEPAGSGKFSLYGGAARLGMVGDPVMLFIFAQMTPEEAKTHSPKVWNPTPTS